MWFSMKTNRLAWSLLLINILSAHACTKNLQKAEPQIETSANFVTHRQSEYQLGFGDVLDIRFFNNRNYNITVPVRPDGNITIEKIGDVFVDGKTPTFVDSVITAEFAKFLKEPEVTVIVTEFGNNHFYILGEVEAPGRYPIAKSMTTFQAVAAAGGVKKDAKMSNAMLIRKAETASPDVIQLNMKNPQDEGKSSPIYLDLKPNDIIYIPNTRISDFAGFMGNVYSTVLPPIDSYLRAIFWSRL